MSRRDRRRSHRQPTSRPNQSRRADGSPLVSVVLPTRDRPRLLGMTLECYRRQTYANRELIVVDDGEAFPVDPAAIESLGGRLIRVETGTTLGTKLNRGLSEARGVFCEKMDDDYYAPSFLELMVSRVLDSQREVCRPTFAMLKPFLFFDLARWELRRSGPADATGATLFFAREDWQERPFRGVRGGEDIWFFLDQLRLGTQMLPVTALDQYLALRHRGGARSRGHTWTRYQSGRDLDQDIREKELYPGAPEAILPDWALAFYRDFREEMLAGAAEDQPAQPRTVATADTPASDRAPLGELGAVLAELEGDTITPSEPREVIRRADGATAASTPGPVETNTGPGPTRQSAARTIEGARVLILTPLKDATDCLDGYCQRLHSLTYPHDLISLGFLESDSSDKTFQNLERRLPTLRQEFRRVGLWKRDFGYQMPPGIHRGHESIQVERRTVLAKSRNHLLFHALDDEDWVLWLDVDVIEYPPDLIERLLATGKEIVQPHCVLDYGGPTFDCNGWRDRGRLHLDDLRGEGELVELDAVGATVLLVRADLHRDGLIFPAFPYGRGNDRIRPERGELETEGLGIMARDMGKTCWGMPHLEVIHHRR